MAPRTEPAFTRLDVDQRRRQLLERGRSLFTRHPYDELSMAAIARVVGISKALLYHYFPSKQAYFVATLQDAAADLAARVRPGDDLEPRAQLDQALAAWLDWVHENREAYGKLMLSAGSVPEVRELIEAVRRATVDLILGRLGADTADPVLRAAVIGWLWSMDGVCLEWTTRDGLGQDAVHRLLAEGLPGLIRAAGHGATADRLS
jgi:AcrR family transcriptional regulator